MFSQEAFICQDGDTGLGDWYDDQIAKIRAQVKAEVLAQIPTIRQQVREEATASLKPWIIAAISAGTLGMIVGGVALWKR
jgi:hypothetical protein